MADDAKLTSVKCLLRSVLQSVKEGVPPRFLNSKPTLLWIHSTATVDIFMSKLTSVSRDNT